MTGLFFAMDRGSLLLVNKQYNLKFGDVRMVSITFVRFIGHKNERMNDYYFMEYCAFDNLDDKDSYY
ncbi:hypothetical protein VT25_15505 [Photobacterium leiognathi subsp. mandapamensis]|nr:hypothetical protein VT25_15505 [Photobacterium leiognathi subsp. mandapamensis]PSV21782.1 hypothetical protein C0W44_06105 [Photobacterium leiognathi subsp. mandapamensis]